MRHAFRSCVFGLMTRVVAGQAADALGAVERFSRREGTAEHLRESADEHLEVGVVVGPRDRLLDDEELAARHSGTNFARVRTTNR